MKNRTFFMAALAAMTALSAQAATQIWVAEPWERITPESKAPTPAPPGLALVAPRNGFASAQLVISSSSPLTALRVDFTDFQKRGGKELLPKSLVSVRYPSRQQDLVKPGGEAGAYFDALSDTLISGETVQPVWLTFSIPAGTPPGDYDGRLRVLGQIVPIALRVAAFTAPEPKERLLIASLFQSPDTVALRYGVEPYSDAHFKLLEPSIALQARAGNNLLYVPVIGRIYHGDLTGMIQFRRNSKQLVPDFKAFERYLDLFVKHSGPPKATIVYLWDAYLGSRKDPGTDMDVTVIGADGKMSVEKVPLYPENKEAWKAVIDGVAERLARVGVPREKVLIGQASDTHPDEATVKMFQEIAPDIKWAVWTHGYGYRGKSEDSAGANGNIVGMREAPDFTPNAGKDWKRGGWNDPFMRLNTIRVWLKDQSDPIRWRVMPDMSVGRLKQGVSRGFGKVGLDYWQLPPKTSDEKAKPYTLWAGPYPGLKYSRLDRGNARAITVPGPAGALSTIRLELLAEGAQETEARIRIEMASPATAEEVVIARQSAIFSDRTTGWSDAIAPSPDWTPSLIKLFDLAGQAQEMAPAKP